MIDVGIGASLLVVGAVVFRFAYFLLRIQMSGRSEVSELSGSVGDVVMGNVRSRVDGKRDYRVSAGMYYDSKRSVED